MNKMLSFILCGIFLVACYFSASAGVNTIDQTFQTMLDKYRLQSGAPSASMSISQSNEPIKNFVSGTVTKKNANNPSPQKITPENLFQIGSITKNFIAAIVLQLEAENKLSINNTIADTVKKYGMWLPAPAYTAWKNVTIKQLLNMSSGIYNYTENPVFLKKLEQAPQTQWSSLDLLKFAYNHKNDFPSGTSYHYSDTNYIILGLLIEAITKQSVQEALKQRLFLPLHLVNTFYLPYLYPESIMKRMAHGYGYTYLAGEFSPPTVVGKDMTRFNLSMGKAAGAMVSTPSDLVHWINALFNGKVLPSKQLKEMLKVVCVGDDGTCPPGKPLSSSSKSNGYGLGIASFYNSSLGGTCWTYVGGTPGYYSVFLWVPHKRAALALMVSATTQNSRKLLHFIIRVAKLLPGDSKYTITA